MKKCLFIVLLGVLSITLHEPARTQTPEPAAQQSNSAARLRKVNIRFVDGSNVVMVLGDDPLEVATKFGKLTVKPGDLREIQFGVHMTEELDQEIKAALRQLGSNLFKQREAAQAKLLKLGPYSYILIKKAKRQKDLETAQRVEILLNEIEKTFDREQLRTTELDRIHTTEFVFTGRVLTKVIKAQTQYFGKVQLTPKDLLAIHRIGETSRAEITISAAEYGSQNRMWMKTNVRLDPKMPVTIRANGVVDLWPQGAGQYMSTPDGYGNGLGIGLRLNQPQMAGRSGGALMGRVGPNGTPFVIGSIYNGRPKSAGRLYLNIAPSPWGNNSTGSYQIKIRSGPSGLFDGG